MKNAVLVLAKAREFSYRMNMRILNTLTRPTVILTSLIVMMLIGASFGYSQKLVGGDLLDLSINGADALIRLGEMNAAQKHAHTLITLIPDSLYPIAYGSFFAGATLKLSKSKSSWLAVPATITVTADFCENIVQMLALNGHENLLAAKSIFTPFKFSAFIIMSALFLVYATIALIRYFRKRSDPSHG